MKELSEHFTKPRKVALYMYMSGTLEGHVWVNEVRYVDYDEHYTTLPEGQLREDHHREAVRISEPIEMKFTAADNEQVVANAVAALDQAERALLDEMNRKIAEIRGRKAQLLSLTHQPEEA